MSRSSAAATPKASHAQLAHTATSPATTRKSVGTAENGSAIHTSPVPGSSTTTCASASRA